MSEYDDLSWLQRCCPVAYARMQGFVLAKRDTKVRRAKRKKFEKMKAEVEALRQELRATCPHALESQKYEQHGREDTLGNYKRGSDYTISCRDCGVTLASWGD